MNVTSVGWQVAACDPMYGMVFPYSGEAGGKFLSRLTASNPLCENMTSSTKPEVRNIPHCRHIGGLSQGHRQHAQKFGEVWPCGF